MTVGGCAVHHSLDWETRVLMYGHLVSDSIVCFLILTVNSLIACALLHQRWCCKETLCPRFKVSSLFVLSLVIADLLVGCTVLYSLVSTYVCSIADFLSRHRFFCLTKTIAFVFSGAISVSSLAAISVDRYVAVMHSLRYPEFMTRRRATAIIIGTWVFSGACALSLFFWNNWDYGRPCDDQIIPAKHMAFIGAPMHVVVLLTIVGTHLSIRREIGRMRARRKAPDLGMFGAQVHRSSVKSLRAVVLVIGCYFVCWVPFTSALCLRILGVQSRALDVTYHFLSTLAIMSASLNPFIYSWKNASVRQALFQFRDKLVLIASGKRGAPPLHEKQAKKTTNSTTSGTSGASGASGASAKLSTVSDTVESWERYIYHGMHGDVV